VVLCGALDGGFGALKIFSLFGALFSGGLLEFQFGNGKSFDYRSQGRELLFDCAQGQDDRFWG
jgi:hypothetical protein